jgi:hypothetical protein
MMANLFINPAPYGDIRFVNDKRANIISYPNSKLVSPYPGVVVNDLTPPCADSIKIKHSFNGETVYSVFCGAKTSVVMGGDVVRQGETIGSFGDDKIKYNIIDKYDDEKPLNDYFSDKNKTPKTTTTTTTLKKRDKDVGSGSGHKNPFLSLYLLPFDLATNVGREIKKDVKGLFKKKETDEENNNLTEEVLRIKNLMK